MTITAQSVKATRVNIGTSAVKNPCVLVELEISGTWSVKVTVQRLRKGIVMRMPTASDSTPGIQVPPDLWKQMAHVALEAVKAEPQALARILDESSRYPSGGKTHRRLPSDLTISPPA